MPQAVSILPVTPPADPRPTTPAPQQAEGKPGVATFGAALKHARKRDKQDSKETKNTTDAKATKAQATGTKTPAKPKLADDAASELTEQEQDAAAKAADGKPLDPAADASGEAESAKDGDPTKDVGAAATPTAAKVATAATADEHPVHAKAKPGPKTKNPDDLPADAKNPDPALVKPAAPDAAALAAQNGDPSGKLDAVNPDGTPSNSANTQDGATSGSSAVTSTQSTGQSSAGKIGGALKAEAATDNLVTTPNPSAADANASSAPDPSAATATTAVAAAPAELQQSDAPAAKPAQHPTGGTFAEALASLQSPPTPPADQSARASHAQPAPPPPQVQFATTNHGSIVKNIQTQLLPNGGSMTIRLDPAELGSMNVSVRMQDGVMTATFETSSDHASRLLSHSLGELKTTLEAAGVTIGGLHVQQTAPAHSNSSPQNGNSNSENHPQDQTSQQQQQEQQRKEMVRRMWRRLNGGKDPLDLVA